MAYDKQSLQASLGGLLAKLSDPDPDIRYMSLNDLLGLIESSNPTSFAPDHTSCSRIVDGLLTTLEDQHGEVQNEALKW